MSDRVETGPVRFGDDWAGVFLRGDYAGPMAFYLSSLFEALAAGRKPSPNITLPLRGLATLLAGSDERGSLDGLQQLPDFATCKALGRRIEAVEALAVDAEAKAAHWRAEADYVRESIERAKADGLREAIKILRGEK